MIHIETKTKIPFLWGKSAFKKSEWSQVNLIVGPNGSGKTLLAEELACQFEGNGKKVLFLRADRKEQDYFLSILQLLRFSSAVLSASEVAVETIAPQPARPAARLVARMVVSPSMVD